MKRRKSKEPSEAQKAARARNFDIMRLEGMIATAKIVRSAPHCNATAFGSLTAAISNIQTALQQVRG